VKPKINYNFLKCSKYFEKKGTTENKIGIKNLQFPRLPQPRSIIPRCSVSLSASNITSVVPLGSSRG